MNAVVQMREMSAQYGLDGICEKVVSGERLSMEEGLTLFTTPHVHVVGALANWVREKRHGDITYFNRNLHINATNVCEADCIFCSFSRLKTGDAAAYTMTMQQAVGRIAALKQTFVSEVHIVNGLNPDLPFSYYTDLLKGHENG